MARYSAVIRPAGADGPFWVHSENPDGNPKTINVTTGLNYDRPGVCPGRGGHRPRS